MGSSESDRYKLYIYTNNHFDPTWRRCWDRRFVSGGQTYVSYADLEAYYLLDNLALARDHLEYKFEAESAIVVRKFLERHPEAREDLVRLAREARFAVSGAGEAIVDSNMILGESLVRNYVVGLLWVEGTFGQKTRIGVRNDAFGNSAQLPQILRGCEITWATGMSYTRAQGIYWRGLDGSAVVHATPPIAAQGGGNTKYPPCPICAGSGRVGTAGCESCGGRGIELVERAWLPGPIDEAALLAFGAGLIPITPEELLPNEQIIEWADAQREKYDVCFALQDDVYPYLGEWFEGLSSPDEAALHPDVELNPNNSGCWVTRIKTKQTCRRQEYAQFGAETLEVMAALQGHPYPREALDEIWQKLFFTMFHDAITATHVDPAYAELQDIWSEVDSAIVRVRDSAISHLVTPMRDTVSVINLTAHKATQICSVLLAEVPADPALVDEQGKPVPLLDVVPAGDDECTLRFVASDVPAYGARRYHVTRGGAQPAVGVVTDLEPAVSSGSTVIENGRFRVEADSNGILAIFDNHLGRAVSTSADYRPAELILEHDEGSPWATLHPDQTRMRLAPYTQFDRKESGEGFQRLIYRVETPRGMGFAGKALTARVEITLMQDVERVDVRIHADWDAFNHRLRVAMPVPFRGRHLYEIPYGVLERTPYEPSFGWAGANGDWPALNWAGVEGTDAGVALLNKGIPSYRIEPASAGRGEVILLSLLRSPAVPTYLHEPEFYTMTEWDGMRDAGSHDFDLALMAYGSTFAESSVVLDADSYNAGLLAVSGQATLPAMPHAVSGCARIAAVKWAEQGNALVVRLHEFRGKGGDASLEVAFPVSSAAKVNMLERQAVPLRVEGGVIRLKLRPWEIATLRLGLGPDAEACSS